MSQASLPSQAEASYTIVRERWDGYFQNNGWGAYPSEEVIRFVARNYYKTPERVRIRFLDLGCGPGAVCWYLSREGFTVDGIDCSPSAIEQAQKRLRADNLSACLTVGPIQRLPYSDNTFDCIIDNASSTSNPWEDVVEIFTEVHRVLKPGGKFYGTVFGMKTGVHGQETMPQFYVLSGGAIGSAPTVRLFREEEVRQLLAGFEQVTIDYHLRTANNGQDTIDYWHFTAVKPAL